MVLRSFDVIIVWRQEAMEKDIFRFEINSQNRLLNHIYKQDNIRIIEGMALNKKCIIICSSNSIYFPDTYDEFRTKIICNNYFDGGRISSLLIEYVERIILIRDVRKNFYVTGISEKYNSIDSVLEMLENLTNGYDIITGGGSAGGYMATIIDSYLNAEYVINAGGQWNLYKYNNIIEDYYFIKKNKDDIKYNKFYNLSDKLQNNSVPIFYMYGGLNDFDIEQVKYAENVKNLYPIAIKSQSHAPSVSIEPYLRLLCATKEEILYLCDLNKGSLIEIDTLEKQINTLIKLPEGLKTSWTISGERKQKAYIELLCGWIKSYQKRSLFRESFADYYKVAIYGKGKYCDLLMNELEKQNRKVICIVETQPLDKMYKGVPVVNLKNLPNEVEMVIIVPYYDIDNIRETCMKAIPDVKVIGIDEYIKFI